jgi:hypothetical protein
VTPEDGGSLAPQPEDLDLNLHRRENLKSATFFLLFLNLFWQMHG